jgi:hypothetical protein
MLTEFSNDRFDPVAVTVSLPVVVALSFPVGAKTDVSCFLCGTRYQRTSD